MRIALLVNRDVESNVALNRCCHGCARNDMRSPSSCRSRLVATGAMLAMATLPVDRTRSLLWHVLSLYPPGVRLIVDAVAQLAPGEKPEAVPQGTAQGRYCGFPQDDDLLDFVARGWRLFDREDIADLFQRYRQRPAPSRAGHLSFHPSMPPQQPGEIA